MYLPEWAWFLAGVFCMAGLIFWHRKTHSRHLMMAAGGLAWSSFVGLPQLYGDLFGYEELSRFTDKLFDDPTWAGSTWKDTGELLVYQCSLISWPGMAFFALGLWRHGSSLVPETPKPMES
jgi:hypothetical protein